MGLNLASIVTDSAERGADNPAIRLGDIELSFGALDDYSARLTTMLGEQGLEKGDRVGVMLPNVPEFAIVYYGVLRAGGVVVPMNVLLKRARSPSTWQIRAPKLLFAWHGFAEGRARAPPRPGPS